MPNKTLQKIKPRKYQQEIYETCRDKNCLVVLPTGIGKTLIALMLSIHQQKKFPGTKILFLAPTRPLAQQHLDYFQKHLPELFADMQLFTGKVQAPQRKKIWQTTDIIFSTPQCISNDLKNNLYTLEDVSLLIEDECHRCLKNYAYTYVAEKYKQQAKNQKILGLTASPGTEKKTIEQIAKNLNIETIEIRTRESDDVKEYIQELNFEIIKLDFPEQFEEIRQLLKILFDKKAGELKKRKLLFMPPTKKFLLEAQSRIMRAIAAGNRHFNLFSGASACAQAIKLQHALELLETQTLFSFSEYIHDLFEQTKQKKSKAVQQLTKSPEFNKAYSLLTELLANKTEHPKLLELKSLIEQEFAENPKTKIIVFSQYRSTIIRICKELNLIPEAKAKVFVGQAKRGEGKNATGLNQREQHEILQEFSLGKINVLCATSIGEEGLDIPEVNAVIFYEPIPSAIRLIQRRGRTARLIPGKLIILITKNTRDEAYYYASKAKERKMYLAMDEVKKQMENPDNNKPKQKKLF